MQVTNSRADGMSAYDVLRLDDAGNFWGATGIPHPPRAHASMTPRIAATLAATSVPR